MLLLFLALRVALVLPVPTALLLLVVFVALRVLVALVLLVLVLVLFLALGVVLFALLLAAFLALVTAALTLLLFGLPGLQARVYGKFPEASRSPILARAPRAAVFIANAARRHRKKNTHLAGAKATVGGPGEKKRERERKEGRGREGRAPYAIIYAPLRMA